MTWFRGALVLGLAVLTIRLAADASAGCFLDLVNLAFHEAGHLFLTPFGETLHFLGGTLGQLAVPGILVGYFLRLRREPFAAAACAWWCGESLTNVAVYMADARDLALPLVGGGHHDWNHLFYAFGLLSQESVHAVSTATRGIGLSLMLASLLWACCFILPARARKALDALVAGRAPALRYLLQPESSFDPPWVGGTGAAGGVSGGVARGGVPGPPRRLQRSKVR